MSKAYEKGNEPIMSGTYTGNGTSQKITTRFQPSKIEIIENDGISKVEKIEDNPEVGYMVNTDGFLVSITITEGGITILNDGFEVGSNIAINEDGTTYYWRCVE